MKLDEIRKLMEKATPGPWVYDNGFMRALGKPETPPFVISSEETDDKIVNDETADPDDMAFIAAMRDLAPKMLAVCEAARAEQYALDKLADYGFKEGPVFAEWSDYLRMAQQKLREALSALEASHE